MRKPNKQRDGLDLVKMNVVLPREALKIGKDLAAKSGIAPDKALGALLTEAIASAASPEAQERIAAMMRDAKQALLRG